MNEWFMSYKVIFENGGIMENFGFYSADSSKSASVVAHECANKIAKEHGLSPDSIFFVSFNRV